MPPCHQVYLSRPLLLDGLKFDLRLYVVLTCAAPLQAFLSVHGVARFASHAWLPVDASNQHDLLMHLSNSSINQVVTVVQVVVVRDPASRNRVTCESCSA